MSPPPAEGVLKRKVLSPQTREVIANVYKFMKTEASLDSPIRLQQVQQRVSLATGVSHSTVKRIVRQLKDAEAAGETASFGARSKFQNPHQTRSVQKSQSNKSKKEQEEEILQPTVEVFVPENCVSNFATEEAYNENNPLDHSSSGEEDNIEEQSITDEDNELSSLPVQVFIKEESHDEDDDETLPGQKHVQTGQYLRSILLNGSKK